MSDTMITPYSSLKNILNGVSFGEYRKLDALNFHSLKDFCTNPLRWKEGYFEKERKETPAMKFGTQAHELLLQGEEVFHQNNALLEPPVNPKTGEPYGTATKAFGEFIAEWSENNQGKRSYTPQDLDALHKMAAESKRNPTFARIVRPFCEDTHSEVMFFGELVPDFKIKGSIDRYDDAVGIVDLKTTSSLENRFWSWTTREYRYLVESEKVFTA